MILKSIFIFFTIMVLTFSANATSLPSVPLINSKNQLRFSVESITVRTAETMGLMGIHFEHFLEQSSPFYYGIGGYGAFSGKRGGFFTAGISGGYQYLFSTMLTFDANIFAGGGGGSSAFPGSGRMIRPSISMIYKNQLAAFSLGIAYETISEIDLGYTVTLGFKSDFNLLEEKKSAISNYSEKIEPVSQVENIKVLPLSVITAYNNYFPDTGSTYKSGAAMAESLPLLSAELQYEFMPTLRLQAGLYAGGGEADGYGKILAGLGYYLPVYKGLLFSTQMLVGLSGGGDVDTGGGIIAQPSIGLELPLDNIVIQAKAARTMTLETGFNANTFSLGAGTRFNLVLPEKQQQRDFLIPENLIDMYSINTSITHKTYFPDQSLKSKSGNSYESYMHLLGFSMGIPVLKPFYLQATTYWAWEGNIGAYAEGSLGILLKDKLSIAENLYYIFQVTMGMAGGGGMEVGDSLISEYFYGLTCELAPSLELTVQTGHMQALSRDAFHAPTLLIGLQFTPQIILAKKL